MSRHEALLMSKLQAAHTVNESLTIEVKFISGESQQQVNDWAHDFEKLLKEADEKALSMRQLVEEIKENKHMADKIESKKQEMALAKKKHEARREQER